MKKGLENLKRKIQNRKLEAVFGAGILIYGIYIWKFVPENQNQKVEFKIEPQNSISKSFDWFFESDEKIREMFQIEKTNYKIETEEWYPFFEISNQDRETIQYIVAGEAGYEPIEGKMAVAQALLNAMKKENCSAKQIRKLYQYSGWKTNLNTESPENWAEVKEAVNRVFDEGEFVSENPILFFYAPKYSSGKFHQTLPHDQMIGGHSFHYLKEDVNADWFKGLQK